MVQRFDIAVPVERRPCGDRRPDEMFHHHQRQQQQQQQHQLSHSRENSLNEYYYNEVYKMNTSEPLYATVIRKRPLPPVGLLEVRYGGREVAQRAAIIIQRAFRASRLRRQYSRLMALAMSSDRLSKRMSLLGQDPDLDFSVNRHQRQNSKGLEPIDILILKAAGLNPGSIQSSAPSQRIIRNRRSGGNMNENTLQRSMSLRMPNKQHSRASSKSRDDLDLESSQSAVPPPCPPLRGENFYPQNLEPVYVTKDSLYLNDSNREPVYGEVQRPRPPQRTVSFLTHNTLPRKMSHVRELQNTQTMNSSSSSVAVKPDHLRTSSTPETFQFQYHPQQHFRAYSSPAPLSPPLPSPPPPPEDNAAFSSESSSRADSPLPPPPYIPPPSPSHFSDGPLPPPPQLQNQMAPPDMSKPRIPSDSGSTVSSMDSGFRSSCNDVVAEASVSPNFIGSPESLASLGDCVFEPRPLSIIPPEEIYVTNTNRVWINDKPQQQVRNYSEVYGSISSNEVTPIKVKKTVRIQTPDVYGVQVKEEELNEVDEMTRRRQYRVGLNLFNQNPDKGMEYLWAKKFLDYSPAAVAKFLKGRKGLSKKKIGEYLCELQRPFNLASLHCFVHELDFTGLHIDIALRQLQAEVTFPGEAQKIEKMVEVFSKRYIQCNQMFVSGFNSPDTVFVLSYAIVLLNTDLHSQALRPNKRMKREDFVRNLQGIDAGADLDNDMLKGIFDRIKTNEFRPGADHVSQVAKVEEAIVGRKREHGKLTQQDRRLVCFCRLSEVPDIHRKAKRDGAHQRGVFLFNDLMIVCKTVTKRKTVHQFRYCLPLRDIRVNVFSTAQFNYGIQLQDRKSGKVVATFNARSDTDQQRFVTDLQESVAEMMEMEKADLFFQETETMC